MFLRRLGFVFYFLGMKHAGYFLRFLMFLILCFLVTSEIIRKKLQGLPGLHVQISILFSNKYQGVILELHFACMMFYDI